jgi:hexulose-6-phosphate isomerase
MIKAISYWSMKDGGAGTHPIDDALAAAKREGFKGLELAIGTAGLLTPETSQAECEDIRHKIDTSGVIVETLASGMSWAFSPTHVSEAIRKQSIELHEKALHCAAWLGCKAMLFVPGAVNVPWNKSYPPVPYDSAVKWAKDAITKLAGTAEKLNIDLCVENVWNGMFYSPLEFAQVIDSIRSPRVGIYFDVGNVLGYHQHPPDWIRILGQRIKRVHIKDFKSEIGNLKGFCDLLEGDVPWKESMDALRAIGYNKTIVAEMMPWRADLLTKTSSAMDTILAM